MIIISILTIGTFFSGLVPVIVFTVTMDCRTCMYATELVNNKFQISPTFAFPFVNLACSQLFPEDVCNGTHKQGDQELSYILQKLQDENPGGFAFSVCESTRRAFDFMWEYSGMYEGFLVGEKCEVSNDPNGFNSWEVKIPDNPIKPRVTPSMDLPQNISIYRVLHLTDAHVLLNYVVGSVVDCGAPYCCYNGTRMARLGEESAGYWGSYKCSIPFVLFEALLDQIISNHPEGFDWIIYTGDSPAGVPWIFSKRDVLEHQEKVLEAITTRFSNIPVYVALGNHDYHPINCFPPHEEKDTFLSGNWLYSNLTALKWAQRSLDDTARSQWSDQGFFSVAHNEHLRLISLNNNFCLAENLVNLLHMSDPGDHLQWLMEELLASEQRKEKVLLISHQPPMDCYPRWRKEWTKIMNRFESTITAIFLGHEHVDYFQIWHNENGQPSIMSFIGPSVTIQDTRNPEYKIYAIASDINLPNSFGRVIDQETWTSDFSQLKTEDDYPKWFKLYDGHDLGVAGNATVDAYKQVLRRAMIDDVLFEKLVFYYNQGIDKGLPEDRKTFLCQFIYNIECDL